MSATYLSVRLLSVFLHLLVLLGMIPSWAQLAGTPIVPSDINTARTNINSKLITCGQPAATFTDDPLVAGIVIKASHLTELRAALTNLYTSQGFPAPSFTDTTIIPGTTPVKAIHYSEILALTAAAACGTCPSLAATWIVGAETCTAVLPATVANSTTLVADTIGASTGTATFRCDASGSWASLTVPEAAPPATCSVLSVDCPATTLTWNQGVLTCSGSFALTAAGSTRTGSDNTFPNWGTATFLCNAGVWAATPTPGALCRNACRNTFYYHPCQNLGCFTSDWTCPGGTYLDFMRPGTVCTGTPCWDGGTLLNWVGGLGLMCQVIPGCP